jgi:hypothetical protein
VFGFLKHLRNRSLTRGVLRGDRVWMVIGAVVWGIRALQWAWPKEESVVYRTVLQPGETLEIFHDTRTEADITRQAKRRRR